MKVKFDGKEFDFDKGMKGRELLKKLNLNPEAVLLVVNGKLISLEDFIEKDQEVEIVKVISGG